MESVFRIGGWGGQAAERVAARWLVRSRSPTADLYLRNACGDWIGPAGPIRQLGPGVFASETTLLVVRHAGGAGDLPVRPRLVWLIDDDVGGTLGDAGTPPGQRLKLALFEQRHARRLLGLGARVVVSADILRCVHPDADLLYPYWSAPLPPLDHHGEDAPLRVGFLGSAVHRGDLDLIRPALERLLEDGTITLSIAANHRLGSLAHRPGVRPVAATSWPGWQRWLARTRLHLALYPLRDTPANRARSVNKIVEHALVGAAGLYSATWPESARIERRRAGLVLPPDPEAWERAVRSLAQDRHRRLALAAAGRSLARDLNHPGLQRAFWRHAFSLSPIGTT